MKAFENCVKCLIEELNYMGLSLDIDDGTNIDDNIFRFKILHNVNAFGWGKKLRDWVFDLTIDEQSNLVIYAVISNKDLAVIRQERYSVRIYPHNSGKLTVVGVYNLIQEIATHYKYHFYQFTHVNNIYKPSYTTINNYYKLYH